MNNTLHPLFREILEAFVPPLPEEQGIQAPECTVQVMLPMPAPQQNQSKESQ